SGGAVGQHGVGGEQAGEHHDVAQQEQPEAEAGDDLDRRRSALGEGHFALVAGSPHVFRQAHVDRSRSSAASCSGGISTSRSMIQPWLRAATSRPTNPMIASHQMCQTSAKPPIEVKKAIATPTALLRGRWMVSKGS